MATPITMPKLGLTMKQGKVVQWHKRDGDSVEAGEPLVVVMSKKITYEIEAPDSGTVRILTPAKETRRIAEPLGYILGPGESLPEEVLKPRAPAAPQGTGPEPEAASAAPSLGPAASEGGPCAVLASPAAKRMAADLGVDLAAVARVAGPGPIQESDVRAFQARLNTAEGQPEHREKREVRSSPAARRLAKELGLEIVEVARTMEEPGPVTESDVRRAHQRTSSVAATPLARRMAKEEGLDLSSIAGSGPGGKVTESDILETLSAPAGAEAIPFAGMREAIARSMMESLRSTAQLTLTARADVTEMVALRDELRSRWSEQVTYNDLIIKAVALALREHPLLNSTLTEDGIILLDEINVGVAVALEAGLIVPVLRAADQKSVVEIHREIAQLAQSAREGSLSVDQVSGGTFTVTNLGAYGVAAFTPILNPPQVGILGVGQVARRPAVVGDQVVPRVLVELSLTIDHRVVDGAPGAAFLQTLVALLEHPALIFAPGVAGRGSCRRG